MFTNYNDDAKQFNNMYKGFFVKIQVINGDLNGQIYITKNNHNHCWTNSYNKAILEVNFLNSGIPLENIKVLSIFK